MALVSLPQRVQNLPLSTERKLTRTLALAQDQCRGHVVIGYLEKDQAEVKLKDQEHRRMILWRSRDRNQIL